MKILHGIKFYGFMVDYTTLKLKYVNFYFINIAMSLLKIQLDMWPTMMPDLIRATAYESEIFPPPFYSSTFHSQLSNSKQSSEIVAISALSPSVKYILA